MSSPSPQEAFKVLLFVTLQNASLEPLYELVGKGWRGKEEWLRTAIHPYEDI